MSAKVKIYWHDGGAEAPCVLRDDDEVINDGDVEYYVRHADYAALARQLADAKLAVQYESDLAAQAMAERKELAQQLADVAYLEAWAQGHPDRELSRWGLGVCVRDERDAMYKADSLPALGALLRQREEGR